MLLVQSSERNFLCIDWVMDPFLILQILYQNMLILLCFALLQVSCAQDDGGYSSSIDIEGITYKTEDSVAIINASVFDLHVATSVRPWLISFTAPWCGHCRSLAPKFATVARTLEGSIAVGKVDATVEQALMGRFPVAGYPTIFFIKDSSVYLYKGARSEVALTKFATTDHVNAERLGHTESPLGYVGVVKGKVINLGFLVQRAYRYLTDGNQVGLSVTSAVAVLAVGGLLFTMLLGFFFAWLFMPANYLQ